jgi:hypothetical protein
MNKTLKLIFLLLIVISLIVALIFGAISCTTRYISETKHQFFCQDIQIGMLKKDVKNALDKYGNYSWQDNDTAELSYVYFNKFILVIALGNPVELQFNSDNRLEAVDSRYKVGDEVQINCNK